MAVNCTLFIPPWKVAHIQSVERVLPGPVRSKADFQRYHDYLGDPTRKSLGILPIAIIKEAYIAEMSQGYV